MKRPKINIRRKPLLIFLAAVFLLFVLCYTYNTWQIRSLNANPQFDPSESNMIARFSLNDSCTIYSVGGQPVNFDMGSRHSFISKESLKQIIASGLPVKESSTLIYTKDSDGHFHWYTKKATLDVFLPNPELPDSAYYIRNVELLVSDAPGNNVFGMDLLKYMVIEHSCDTDELIIYRHVPNDGYVPVSDITLHDNMFGDFFGRTNRASVTLTVNDDKSREYFFDTGGKMRHYEIVQPEDCRTNATTAVIRDTVYDYWVQQDCRVSFGNRMRFSTVVYANNLHTDDYSANPLRLFDQDCIIDFPGRQLMIRKTKDR